MEMNKNKYQVGFEVETGIRYTQPSCEFTINGMKAHLIFSKDEGSIQVFAEIEAATHKEAFELSFEAVDKILDSLAYITKNSFYNAGVFVILRSHPGDKTRICFRQLIEESQSQIILTPNRVKESQKILDSTAGKKEMLGLRWLRLGHRSRSIWGKFVYYWLALERLIGDTQIKRKCEECGATLPSYPSTNNEDLENFLKQNGENITKEKIANFKDLRNRVFHGGKPFSLLFARSLREPVMEISKAVERYLDSYLDIRDRVPLKTPLNIVNRASIAGYYQFKTKTPEKEFCNDFPTEKQLRNFNHSSRVKNRKFQLINEPDKW